MQRKEIRLSYTALWILAGLTGAAENWILRNYGLNVTQRMTAVVGFLPLLIFLVLVCIFQQLHIRREQ